LVDLSALLSRRSPRSAPRKEITPKEAAIDSIRILNGYFRDIALNIVAVLVVTSQIEFLSVGALIIIVFYDGLAVVRLTSYKKYLEETYLKPGASHGNTSTS